MWKQTKSEMSILGRVLASTQLLDEGVDFHWNGVMCDEEEEDAVEEEYIDYDNLQHPRKEQDKKIVWTLSPAAYNVHCASPKLCGTAAIPKPDDDWLAKQQQRKTAAVAASRQQRNDQQNQQQQQQVHRKHQSLTSLSKSFYGGNDQHHHHHQHQPHLHLAARAATASSPLPVSSSFHHSSAFKNDSKIGDEWATPSIFGKASSSAPRRSSLSPEKQQQHLTSVVNLRIQGMASAGVKSTSWTEVALATENDLVQPASRPRQQLAGKSSSSLSPSSSFASQSLQQRLHPTRSFSSTGALARRAGDDDDEQQQQQFASRLDGLLQEQAAMRGRRYAGYPPVREQTEVALAAPDEAPQSSLLLAQQQQQREQEQLSYSPALFGMSERKTIVFLQRPEDVDDATFDRRAAAAAVLSRSGHRDLLPNLPGFQPDQAALEQQRDRENDNSVARRRHIEVQQAMRLKIRDMKTSCVSKLEALEAEQARAAAVRAAGFTVNFVDGGGLSSSSSFPRRSPVRKNHDAHDINDDKNSSSQPLSERLEREQETVAARRAGIAALRSESAAVARDCAPAIAVDQLFASLQKL